jgi:hypothetical protein
MIQASREPFRPGDNTKFTALIRGNPKKLPVRPGETTPAKRRRHYQEPQECIFAFPLLPRSGASRRQKQKRKRQK